MKQQLKVLYYTKNQVNAKQKKLCKCKKKSVNFSKLVTIKFKKVCSAVGAFK